MAKSVRPEKLWEGRFYSAGAVAYAAMATALSCVAFDAEFNGLSHVEHFVGQVPDYLNDPIAGIGGVLALLGVIKTIQNMREARIAYRSSKLGIPAPIKFAPLPPPAQR